MNLDCAWRGSRSRRDMHARWSGEHRSGSLPFCFSSAEGVTADIEQISSALLDLRLKAFWTTDEGVHTEK